MNKKILMVDDEVSLLNGFERRLGLDYELSMALSGDEGLALIESEGPFAVIVSDMRMPHMNGIEFLREARKIAPESVALMLTGNQDQSTAMQAVNEGQVFRFLNKPCSQEHLRGALDAALRQYELLTAEKELLHSTFCGAVNVLAEVLEVSQPAVFSRSSGIHELVESLRTRVGIDKRWEYKLASKLSLLGFALMPESESLPADGALLQCPDYVARIEKASHVASRLIEKIPRLGIVAAMIREQSVVSGRVRSVRSEDEVDVIQTGATLLRIALHIECLSQQGISATEGVLELQEALPELRTEFVNAISDSWPEAIDRPMTEVRADRLMEGMVLADDVITSNGAILLRKGRRLTATIIERLQCHKEKFSKQDSIKVYQEGESKEQRELQELFS